MNDTQPLTRPDVTAFVAEVRSRLDDLSQDEREELLGGLEADLADKVADGAPLGDPVAYAEELRAAAGLPVRTRRLPRPALPRRAHVERALDGSREWFFDLVRARSWSTQAWDLAATLRPAWWAARAWVALTTLDIAMGPWEPVSLIPSLGLGHPLWGTIVLAAAMVGSTLLGMGKVWPGSGPRRPVAARLVLLALNVVALLLPLTFNIPGPGYLTGTPFSGGYDSYSAGYQDARREPGLRSNGRDISNVFAYDAQGRPLTGVQLFDQDGRPVSVSAEDVCGVEVNREKVFNVFPLERKLYSVSGCGPDKKQLPQHPLALVPAVDGVPAEAEAVPTEEKDGTKDKGRGRERQR